MKEAVSIYKKFFQALGIPHIVSKRPDWDKFPGADYTMAFDTVLPDGKALQIGTVHNLGIKFSETFGITFENLKGEQEYAFQTCYGISDRVIASQIAVHGDDKGLSLIPAVAPIQCVIVPILYREKEDLVNKAVEEALNRLSKVRVHVDRSETTPGNKFYHWEMKGVPLRLEIGPRDAESRTAVLVRRDTGVKKTVAISNIEEEVSKTLEKIALDMKKEAQDRMAELINDAGSIEEARNVLKHGGIVRTLWCKEKSCGIEIEEALNATLLGTNEETLSGKCLNCRRPGESVLFIAKSY